jgi:hypothetical protein
MWRVIESESSDSEFAETRKSGTAGMSAAIFLPQIAFKKTWYLQADDHTIPENMV